MIKFNSTQDDNKEDKDDHEEKQQDENARLLKAIKDLDTIASHSENKVPHEQDEASSEDSSFFNSGKVHCLDDLITDRER